MALPAFDTLKFVETLKAAGMTEKQAKALTEAQRDIFIEVIDTTFSTKEDINRLDHKIDENVNRLERKIDEHVNRLERKIDEDVNRLERKIDKVEARVDNLDIKFTGKFNLLYWMQGFLLAGIAAILLRFH